MVVFQSGSSVIMFNIVYCYSAFKMKQSYFSTYEETTGLSLNGHKFDFFHF